MTTFAPAPDFRYVGLEPITLVVGGRVAVTALGLGAGVSVAMAGLDTRHALLAGAVASVLSALALRNAGAAPRAPLDGSARMAIVPWGVLVDTDETPRILRWAAIRKIDVETSSRASRVAVETEHDRFVGEALGAVTLERLREHFDAYALEQSTPLALDLDGTADASAPSASGGPATSLDAHEPSCEALLGVACGWLDSAGAATRLALAPAGYRRTSTHAATSAAVDVLRCVLRDRTPKPADPRAFAAVLAAELNASELAPELVALTQCPHPLVAAVARQAARKLGVPKAKTGTLEEVAPFLCEGDRDRLENWVRR